MQTHIKCDLLPKGCDCGITEIQKCQSMTTEKEREQMVEEIIEIVNRKKIKRFSHVFNTFTKISLRTAYNYGFHELHEIKDAIEKQREKAKQYLLDSWITSDNPTLNISAMRLLADSDEHRKLNQNYIDHTTGDEKISTINVVVHNKKEDE